MYLAESRYAEPVGLILDWLILNHRKLVLLSSLFFAVGSIVAAAATNFTMLYAIPSSNYHYTL